MKGNKPEVYIVILNWNRIYDTLECLESLGEISYPNYEVVLVDNGSRNEEGARIKEKYPNIHLIQNDKNEGFVKANNRGMRYALERGADYILLLNNDTVVAPDFLQKLVDYAEGNEDVGAVGPKMLYYETDKIWFNGADILWWLGFNRHRERLMENSKSKITSPTESDYITSCCVLKKRQALERVGVLDPVYFIYYDDVDWAVRAKRAGYKNVVVPGSVIWHKVSVSSGVKGRQSISSFQAYLYSKNAVIFGRKNLRGIKKLFYLASQFTLRLVFNFFLCVDNKARKEYIRGLGQGFSIDLKSTTV